MEKKLIFLVGPTGIGKSSAALWLARKLNAEIVSCDSMQVYRKMDIITSKPTSSERRLVKHYMLDIIAPSRKYDVASFRKEALEACRRIILKGKTPLLVGGSGLYYSVLIDGLFERSGQDRQIRSKLTCQLKKQGNAYLYRKLAKVDPESADKIHPNDSRRIIRALEVYLKTGRKISQLQKERVGLEKDYKVKIFGLDMARDALYEKINERVESMFDSGLINEVKKVFKFKLSNTARFAIGLSELRDFLKGKTTFEESKELIKKNTRNYAKRQLTWFRKDKRISWVKINKEDSPKIVAEKIWRKL